MTKKIQSTLDSFFRRTLIETPSSTARTLRNEVLNSATIVSKTIRSTENDNFLIGSFPDSDSSQYTSQGSSKSLPSSSQMGCKVDKFLGLPLKDFGTESLKTLPVGSIESSIVWDLRLVNGENVSKDLWDPNHVRMPYSDQNIYSETSNRTIKRWSIIQNALNPAKINSSYDLEEAILSYNKSFASSWNFRGLHKYCDILPIDERHYMFDQLLPEMIKLALQLPDLCPKPIPLAKKGHNCVLVLTQRQIASLLANAFFCTFPHRNRIRRDPSRPSGYSEYADFPRINFSTLFMPNRCNLEKLKFIMHYFRRVTESPRDNIVTFERRSLGTFVNWKSSDRKVSGTKLHVSSIGTIEDLGENMLQVDFANEFIGGGVLSKGSVQEEIRFLINTELFASMLFMQKMYSNEAILITGCERYSCYTGYADSLKFSAPFYDNTPKDSIGRIATEIVAIDALPFYSKPENQFLPHQIERELNKAYAGFYEPGIEQEHLKPIATGNWGCGAFRGDKELKSLIQLIVAAQCKRNLVYFTFGDECLMQRFHELYELLCQNRIVVGQLFNVVCSYHGDTDKKNQSLYDFIKRNIV